MNALQFSSHILFYFSVAIHKKKNINIKNYLYMKFIFVSQKKENDVNHHQHHLKIINLKIFIYVYNICF